MVGKSPAVVFADGFLSVADIAGVVAVLEAATMLSVLWEPMAAEVFAEVDARGDDVGAASKGLGQYGPSSRFLRLYAFVGFGVPSFNTIICSTFPQNESTCLSADLSLMR
jgi:hypothetical protein